MNKGQADILSMSIILAISISLFSVAYIWGVPLIQKYQSRATVTRVSSYFDQNNANSLPSEIEYVANNGGEKTFISAVDGLWQINEDDDSIAFSFFSKVTNIASGDWRALTYGTGTTCPPSYGLVGPDRVSVVCAKADAAGNGYNVTYKIWFRELNETTASGFKIDLIKQSGVTASTSTGKSIKISFVERTAEMPYYDRTLSVSKVMISFL